MGPCPEGEFVLRRSKQPGRSLGSVLRIKAVPAEQFWPAVLAGARGQVYVKIHMLSQSPWKSMVMLSAPGWESQPGKSCPMSLKAKG